MPSRQSVYTDVKGDEETKQKDNLGPNSSQVTGEDHDGLGGNGNNKYKKLLLNPYGAGTFGLALRSEFKLPEINEDKDRGKFDNVVYDQEDIPTTQMNNNRKNMRKRKPKIKKTRATRIENHKLKEPN